MPASFSKQRKQAMADVRACDELNYPDERLAARAEEGYRFLIANAYDDFNRRVERYNLGGLYEKLQEPELAYEQYRLNLEEDPADTLSAVQAASVLLERNSPIYSEEKAWQFLASAKGSLRAGVLKIRILAPKISQPGIQEKIEQILEENLPGAAMNREFPYQPFPEYAAVFTWFSLVKGNLDPDFDYPALLEDALTVLEKRRAPDGWTPKDRMLRAELYELYDLVDAM